MLRGIVTEVVRANPEGLLLIAINPVDALTFAARRGWPPWYHRVCLRHNRAFGAAYA